jgi:phosphoenolpyruvate carboxykinase (GTP)
MRVLKWMVERCSGRADAVETALGFVPRYDDLDWAGLEFGVERFVEVMHIDNAQWAQELGSHDALFDRLGDKRPDALMTERARLEGIMAM